MGVIKVWGWCGMRVMKVWGGGVMKVWGEGVMKVWGGGDGIRGEWLVGVG